MGFIFASTKVAPEPPEPVPAGDFTIVVLGSTLTAISTHPGPLDGGTGTIPKPGTYASLLLNLVPGHQYSLKVDGSVVPPVATADGGGVISCQIITTITNALLTITRQ